MVNPLINLGATFKLFVCFKKKKAFATLFDISVYNRFFIQFRFGLQLNKFVILKKSTLHLFKLFNWIQFVKFEMFCYFRNVTSVLVHFTQWGHIFLNIPHLS